MYVVIRRYVNGGPIEEIARRAREGVVPMLRRHRGFRAYYVLGCDDGSIVSVSVFDDQEAAMSSNDQVRQWVAANLKDLLPTPSEILAGAQLFEDIAPRQGSGGNPHVALTIFDGMGPVEEIAPLSRQHLLPALRQQPGFRGMLSFRNAADPRRAVSVSIHDSREAAEATAARMGELQAELRAKHPGAFPNPPTRTGGTALIAELA